MRHPHRHRSFAPAMRGQRPALASVLAWLALLAMLLASLPVLEQAVPGSTAMVLQLPAEERPAGGGETTPQEDPPAKPRRVASLRTAATPQPQTPPRPAALDALQALMSSLQALPPQVLPSIDSAPATPWPAAPGLRVQRGQAPPQS